MALTDDIISDTAEIFGRKIEVTKGRVIPSIADLPFGNQGRELHLVSLFVDVRKSTQIADAIGCEPAARMYKAYLRGVTKVVRARSGDILSFNGDGVVAGFVGDGAESSAVLSAFNIAWFCDTVLGPRVNALLPPASQVSFDFGIGIDSGKVVVVRGGVRGEENSDLVWAGNPVNYSVKLAMLAEFPYGIYVSNAVMQATNHALYHSLAKNQTYWGTWYWQAKGLWLWRSSWWIAPSMFPTVPSA